MRDSSVVSLVRSTDYRVEALGQAIEEALQLIGQPLARLVRPGARVLIKPYLRHGSVRLPETRMVSHPALIEASIRLVRDCGGHPVLGDEGSRYLHNPPLHPDALWLHLLADRSGAELVSFAKAGGRVLPSRIPRPRDYLLTRAVLDADVVISLANPQPHPSLIWSGAVKNMFNALIGEGGSRIFTLLYDEDKIAAAMADVCRLCRPTVSLADMGTICPGYKEELWRVGLLGASTDPVALDSACVQALGWNPAEIPGLTWGEQLGVGHWQRERIELRGLPWTALPVFDVPRPPLRADPPETALQGAVRTLTKTTLRSRPVIDRQHCSHCGDCARICPVGAIRPDTGGAPRIDYARCADCMVCADACRDKAIQLAPRGWVAALRWPATQIRRMWRRGKAGHVWRAGPIALRWHLEIAKPVRTPRRHQPPVSVEEPKDMDNAVREPLESGLALIVGAGPGLGSALARRFARAGMDVAVVARNGHRLDGLVAELQALGVTARAFACDITQDRQVVDTVRAVCCEMDVPKLAVYNVEHFGPGHVVDIETDAFLECWRVNCLGAFLVGREVARAMLTRGRGTLIFTGATAATRGRDGYANMAVGKWGQRALAQCMARELGPKGIHVAHVIIDGGILKDYAPAFMHERMLGLFPDEIAENYLALHRQHPSAWTQELDLRPWVEKF